MPMEEAVGSPPPGRQRRPFRHSRGLQGAIYATPTAIFVCLFFLIPVALVMQMSASDWGLIAGNKGWNFPDNFTKVVDHRHFWPSILFTFKYTLIVTVILIGLGLAMALIVQDTGRWRSFLRTSFLVPSALGLASASLLFWGLYSPQSGPLSPILKSLGLIDESISFLGTPNSALWSTVFLIVWRYAGFYMLILMVGLQRIPPDVYEAARIDGASRMQTFFRVTLPLLKSSIALSLILCVTGSLLAFDQFYILTKGGPDNSTITVVQLIYNQAFGGSQNLGTAAALSMIVLLILIVINALQFRMMRNADDN
ncbi:sugar ABC transporter permease [Nakamurella silvestris]|nr:sugar ABC transporter permease [Nakamurella silvestris]